MAVPLDTYIRSGPFPLYFRKPQPCNDPTTTLQDEGLIDTDSEMVDMSKVLAHLRQNAIGVSFTRCPKCDKGAHWMVLSEGFVPIDPQNKEEFETAVSHFGYECQLIYTEKHSEGLGLLWYEVIKR